MPVGGVIRSGTSTGISNWQPPLSFTVTVCVPAGNQPSELVVKLPSYL